MEPTSPYRPRVSRETRLLLTAGLLAIAALWLLARVRFRDHPSPPSPIPAVLGQLATGPKYDDLAAEIGDLSSRLSGALVVLDAGSSEPVIPGRTSRLVALRHRDDLAVTLLPPGVIVGAAQVVARDPASGVAVVRLPSRATGGPQPLWTPRRPERPRYLAATDPAATGVWLRPVFVGPLEPIASALWADALWTVPASSDVAPGAFLFTSTGSLVGLVIRHGEARAVVPGATLIAEADRLLARPGTPNGVVGVEVQDVTPPIASATGATSGVVVTWVDKTGAGGGQLLVGDVIESLDGRSVTRDAWDVRIARLRAGETLALRVRSRGRVQDVALVAAAPPEPPASRTLGLTLRGRPGIGADVVRLESSSAADRAGLHPGDVITAIGAVQAPTPAQVARSFSATPAGQRIVVGVRRGNTHFVTTLHR
jgi:hypothetical protein